MPLSRPKPNPDANSDANPDANPNSHSDVVLKGMVRSIRIAHESLRPGRLKIATGTVQNASRQRAPESYMANPPEERAKYGDVIDKEMQLLRLEELDGRPMGCINWFAVHPSNMGGDTKWLNGDNKGYASYCMEVEHGTHHRQTGYPIKEP